MDSTSQQQPLGPQTPTVHLASRYYTLVSHGLTPATPTLPAPVTGTIHPTPTILLEGYSQIVTPIAPDISTAMEAIVRNVSTVQTNVTGVQQAMLPVINTALSNDTILDANMRTVARETRVLRQEFATSIQRLEAAEWVNNLLESNNFCKDIACRRHNYNISALAFQICKTKLTNCSYELAYLVLQLPLQQLQQIQQQQQMP